MPPVVLLFLLEVVILAQLFHTLFPGRITYLRRVILALIGVSLGELAGRLLLPGPMLGDLHAGWGIALTTALQLLGNRVLREPAP